MDEKTYRAEAERALRRVIDAFDEVDVDDADVESRADVIHIRYRDGSRAVLNTQGPAKQIWLAGAGRGWHFSFDPASGEWRCDKGSGDELFAVLRRLSEKASGLALKF